jgi:hypothetical protein
MGDLDLVFMAEYEHSLLLVGPTQRPLSFSAFAYYARWKVSSQNWRTTPFGRTSWADDRVYRKPCLHRETRYGKKSENSLLKIHDFRLCHLSIPSVTV